MVCAVFTAADAVEVVADTLGEVLQSGDRAADGVSVLAVVTNNCFSICVAFYLIFFSRSKCDQSHLCFGAHGIWPQGCAIAFRFHLENLNTNRS